MTPLENKQIISIKREKKEKKMLDIRFIRENPDVVKENIRKKYQDAKLPLVDEVIDLDAKNRAAITEASDLRAQRNRLSKANGPLFGKLKKAAE
jgi:seryl-tRNA synthetase